MIEQMAALLEIHGGMDHGNAVFTAGRLVEAGVTLGPIHDGGVPTEPGAPHSALCRDTHPTMKHSEWLASQSVPAPEPSWVTRSRQRIAAWHEDNPAPEPSARLVTVRDTYFFEAGVAEGKRLAATPQDTEA